MPPVRENCPKCGNRFYGKQKLLTCVMCEARYHLACLNLSEGEYECYLEKSYKCTSCLNKKTVNNDDTPIKTSANSKLVLSCDKSSEPGSSVEHFSVNNVSTSVLLTSIERIVESRTQLIIQNFKKEITSLKVELGRLSNENAQLKSVVDQIKLDKKQAVEKLSICSVAAQTDTLWISGTDGSQSEAGSPLSASSVNTDSAKHECAGKKLSSSNESEGWAAVVKRGRRQPLTDVAHQEPKKRPAVNKKMVVSSGSTNTSLVAVKKFKALFITRFCPNATKDVVQDLVQNMGVPHAQVTKLKTRGNSYSSFHVMVEELYFDKIYDPTSWPAGLLMAPFRGKLHENHKFVAAESLEETSNKQS